MVKICLDIVRNVVRFLKNNKIYIGDSSIILDNIENDSIDLVVTSPPYCVGKEYGKYDDNMKYGDYLQMLAIVFRKCFNVMKDHSFICINIGRNSGINTVTHISYLLEKIGFKYVHNIQWKKPYGAGIITFFHKYPFGRYYMPVLITEDILVYSKGKINGNRGERISKIPEDIEKKYDTNVWEINPKTDSDHPAPFPLQLPLNCIYFYSNEGDTVLDPFLGSGTTTKAAVIAGRNSIGIELNKDYLPIIKKHVGYGQQKLGEDIKYEIIGE